MRVLFLGNHTVGVETLATILDGGDQVVGVVAHPPDPEDGARYRSVFATATERGLDVERITGRDPALAEFVAARTPDLLWVTDYRYLIPADVIALVPLGAVNLHPSLLPRYRGRASLNWAIIEGERELGLTAHFIDAGMDSGDIIAQRRFELGEHEDVGHALDRLYPVYRELTSLVLDAFRRGQVPRSPQDHALATSFPARRPADGLVDWSQPSVRVRDLVRAVARPYPGAFTFHRGLKITVWSATLHEAEGQPGEVVDVSADGPVVAAGRGAVALMETEAEQDGSPVELAVGDCLGPHP